MSLEDSVREYIPLEKIEFDPDQPRKNFGDEDDESKADLRRLKKSIEELGILDPIKVTPNTEGKFVIIDGHRRATIAKELGYTTIKCDVFPTMDAKVFQKARYHLQNMLRNWKPLERAELFQQLKNLGGFKTNKEVSAYIGVSESLVGNALHLRGYKLQYLELMAQYHLPGTYDIQFTRLKDKLRKIKDIEIDKIIRILLDKIRYKVIKNAKDLRRVGQVFLRASMHEDELHEFLTTDMTVKELNDKVELTGSVWELERVIDLMIRKLQNSEPFTQKELEGIDRLRTLIPKVPRSNKK